MIKPMLAASFEDARKKNTITDWTQWVAEVKYDGIRLIVDNTDPTNVRSFTRTRDGLLFDMPPHLREQFARLAPGWYDGEALNGDISTDVKRKDLRHQMSFVLFDVLHTNGIPLVMGKPYTERRKLLTDLYRKAKLDTKVIHIAEAVTIKDSNNLTEIVKAIWDVGGEGVILKKKTSPYLPDTRKADAWVKIKNEMRATLPLVGFKPSKGTVRFPGHPFAIVHVRDKEGNETTAKVVNDYEMRRIEEAWSKAHGVPFSIKAAVAQPTHPWVGKRKAVITFQQRTRDGGYRGPVRFDRWDGE